MRSIRLRPWFRWVLPRLVCATLIYLGGYTALNAWLSTRLAAEVAAIRERGEPVNAEELVHPEVPAELDAGPYLRAWRTHLARSWATSGLRPWSSPTRTLR